jgi:hypothetical protein
MTMKRAVQPRPRPVPLARTVTRHATATLAPLLIAASLISAATATALAQASWNPFDEQTGVSPAPRRPQKTPPAGQQEAPIWGAPSREPPDRSGLTADGPVGGLGPRDTVEQTDLPPLPPADGPPVSVAGPQAPLGVPGPQTPLGAPGRPPLQQSSSATAGLVAALREIELPTRSRALSELLLSLAGPGREGADRSLEGVGARATALLRAGRIREADAVVRTIEPEQIESDAARGALRAFHARLALATADRDRACTQARALLHASNGVPRPVVAEAIGINGYCGAAAGNSEAAGLAAALAREQGGMPPSTLTLLDTVAAGGPVDLASLARPSVLDWRLAELSGKLDVQRVNVETTEAATLVAMAESLRAPPRLRVTAAEAAARIVTLSPEALADAYRSTSFPPEDLSAPFSARVEPWARRALLYKAAEAERTPLRRARNVRAALDDARRADMDQQMAAALAPLVTDIRPVAEVGWFAETAVEVMLSANRFEDARRWARLGMEASVTADRPGASLSHWLALVDIADPDMRTARGQSLPAVEEMAMRGRFTPEALHKLATVLDALDYAVPTRLWEAASRAPQPATGHLPATGVLSELQAAVKARDRTGTLALVFRTLGRNGPAQAHMIALGDAIRALKRVGLEREARIVALDALFGIWPRGTSI